MDYRDRPGNDASENACILAKAVIRENVNLHPFPLIPAKAGISLAILSTQVYVHRMFFTYMVTNNSQVSLYTGHTDDLSQRMTQHRLKAFAGFTAKYNCTRLVWFETHDTRHGAFTRERQIKAWKRAWKNELVEVLNPHWRDLYEALTEAEVYGNGRRYLPPGEPRSQLSLG